MEKIGVVIQARTGSQRCRNKLLRPFAGTSLLEIALEKFSKPSDKFTFYFAAHERELLELGRRYTDNIVERGRESAEADDIRTVMNYFEGFEEETVAFLNPCHPFFRMETLERAIDHFRESEAVSMTSVVKSHTWYYHLDGRPINFLDPTVINTKATERLLAVAHAFHIFPRKRFLEHGYMWRHAPRDPVFFEIPEREAIDVDTELDFEIAEALYGRMVRKARD